MGFNIKNNYGPNIDNHDGGIIKLTMGREGRWAADAEEAEIVEEVKASDDDCDVEHQALQPEVSTTRETERHFLLRVRPSWMNSWLWPTRVNGRVA